MRLGPKEGVKYSDDGTWFPVEANQVLSPKKSYVFAVLYVRHLAEGRNAWLDYCHEWMGKTPIEIQLEGDSLEDCWIFTNRTDFTKQFREKSTKPMREIEPLPLP